MNDVKGFLCSQAVCESAEREVGKNDPRDAKRVSSPGSGVENRMHCPAVCFYRIKLLLLIFVDPDYEMHLMVFGKELDQFKDEFFASLRRIGSGKMGAYEQDFHTW